MDEQKQKEIKRQIEYYLSDLNLETDEFFHKIISNEKEGYIDLEYIMQCNKVKKAGWDLNMIIESIKDSDQVELNLEKTKIRRKGNKPLPELNETKLLNKKRHREKKENKITPIILIFSSDKDTELKWQDIESKYKSLNPTLSVLYTRFKINEGHFGIIPMGANTKNEEKKDEINFVKEFELDGVKFTVKLCEGKDLEKFMEENQSHLDLIVNKERNKKLKKKNKTILETPVKLGEEEFNDIAKIKEKIRKMMSQVKDELIILHENENKFIKDLVKFHPEKDLSERVNNAAYIGVGKIDPHQYTKAFFALDDKKEKLFDFFVNKCPEKILIADFKKNK
jgi:hypothetical protein